MDLKRLAVEQEDYETAKKIKSEIERIKNSITLIDPEKGVPISIANAELKQHLAETQPSLHLMQSKLKAPLKFDESLKEFEQSVKEDGKQNSSFINSKNPIIESRVSKRRYEDQVIPALQAKKRSIEDEI